MASRTAHLREQLTETLTALAVPADTSLTMGAYVVAQESSRIAGQLAARVAEIADDGLDEFADRALMHLLGLALGRDGLAGAMVSDPFGSLRTSRTGEGASRVALAMLELWASLERPLPASAIAAAFVGADDMAAAQRAAVERDAARRRSG